MKLTYLLLVVVVLVALQVSDGDAWRIRRVRLPRIRLPRIRIPRIRIPRIRLPRIRLPRIRLRRMFGDLCQKHACGYLCDTVLKKDCQYCYTACPSLCSKLGKRELSNQQLYQEIEDVKNLRAMPSDFSIYDADNDKAISREEFARALRSSVRLSREAFDYGDTNGDGLMDIDEFDHAPYYRDENDLEALKARVLSDDDIEDEEDDSDDDTLKRLLEDDDLDLDSDNMSEDEFVRALNNADWRMDEEDENEQ